MTIGTNVMFTFVPEGLRLDVTAELFGVRFSIRIEPVVFLFSEQLSRDYNGVHWELYTLNNGSFQMAPAGNDHFHVLCENQFEGDLLADAFGITVCMYTYSYLPFAGPEL